MNHLAEIYERDFDAWIQSQIFLFEGKSWRKTIIEQRVQLSFLIKKVPSLKSSLHLAMTEAYTEARRLAIKETTLAPDVFPVDCPYSVEQLFDEDFYPDCAC